MIVFFVTRLLNVNVSAPAPAVSVFSNVRSNDQSMSNAATANCVVLQELVRYRAYRGPIRTVRHKHVPGSVPGRVDLAQRNSRYRADRPGSRCGLDVTARQRPQGALRTQTSLGYPRDVARSSRCPSGPRRAFRTARHNQRIGRNHGCRRRVDLTTRGFRASPTPRSEPPSPRIHQRLQPEQSARRTSTPNCPRTPRPSHRPPA